MFASIVLAACAADSEDPDEGPGVQDVTSCDPKLAFYPVRAKHNTGYDPAAGDASKWTCDAERSNSDYTKGGNHLGIDIWAAEGAPVVATVDGTLTLVGRTDYTGNKVTIIDRCGWYHYATHLQGFGPGIGAESNGRKIKAGEVIGYVGKTGKAANGVVHLHYSLYPAGSYERGIDPWKYLKEVESNVCSGPGADLAAPSGCAVRDGRLHCTNAANTPLRAAPSATSEEVDVLRTTESWFECWTTGERHAGGNTTWYRTVGDDTSRRGWAPASALRTPDDFDADPAAKGLARCG
jgi:hypothetical protein